MAPTFQQELSSQRMLTPRATKLRSQRDIDLWRIPLKLSLAAVGLFAITLIPDILDKYGIIHIPSWLTMGSIDDARAILAAMMGAVATVLALIFSVALLVLSMVSTLFGPRLLYRFLQDWVTQVTIGLFMGAFVYICLVFLVRHQDPQSTFIPQVSLITSWALIVLKFRRGHFVLRGEALAAIVPADNGRALEMAIDHGVHIGRHRTLTQDSEFGIAQVVEIAIRALSPAVNDTVILQ